jgi:hypothetical protein
MIGYCTDELFDQPVENTGPARILEIEEHSSSDPIGEHSAANANYVY